MLDIRSAKNSETDALIEFLSEVNGHHYKPLAEKYVNAMFADHFRKPHFVIALRDDELIGAAAYSEEIFTVNTWGISWVSVKENSRDKGIGQKIVEECLRQIARKAQNTVTVILATHPLQTGLYDKLGFKPLGNDHEGGQFMSLTVRKSLH